MEWQKVTGYKMKPLNYVILILTVLFSISPVSAWNNHAGITYLILREHWKLKPPANVKVESLESFLLKEKNSLAQVLNEADSFIASKLPHCPIPSEDLKFDPIKMKADTAVPLFFKALRVNPSHKPALYKQAADVLAKKPSSLLKEITTLHELGKLTNETFLPLSVGTSVTPAEVLITAVDEPDYDLDMYLFSDSDSEFGKVYGFGEQSFGNPKYEFSSQAPFHMGFYHESSLIFTLAGFLKKTYPEYRIYQFTKLSEHAFKTGHPYWGYRFAGWALHYIQDLTQPYHSSVLPRVGAGKQIGVQLLAMIGLPGSKEKMIDYISNRHTLIEEYQYYLIKDLLFTRNKDHIVYRSLQTTPNTNSVSTFDFDSVRNVISKQAYDAAIEADYEIEQLGILKYEMVYEESHPIHKILAKLLANTSSQTRSYLDSLKVP
ncbi:hypothetical protein [Leptospira ognonensis]|nr:hypothetical protein [Leptospira ognonensis]